MTDVVVTGSSDRWQAHLGADLVGTLRALVRPDQRCQLFFRDCRAHAHAALVQRAALELHRDLYAVVDEPGRRRLTALGFTTWRIERYYRIPTDPARLRLPQVGPPTGVDLVSASEADLDRLRTLDDRLRQDIPGSDGWRWSPQDFREETFSDGFDPATYQVAVERRTGEYVGLVRVWMKPAGPRLGCLGVLSAFRRTRVTAALLGAVLASVHRRGHSMVETDIDVTNRAANALATRCGASYVGEAYHVVLRRPGRPVR